MNENAKKLLLEFAEDVQWAERLKAAEGKDKAVALVLEKAAEQGVELTAADFEMPEGELSEDELLAVAGGAICVCSVAGGGMSGDIGPSGEGDGACGCFIGGYGYWYEADGDEGTRCACVQVGTGATAY